jgi:hypothetical protein
MTRQCARCGEKKPIEDFPADPGKKSGLRGTCRTCEAGPPGLTPAQVAAMCTQKRRFKTWSAAAGQAQRRARFADLIRVYGCPVCLGFHLTSKPAAQKKAS